MKKILEIISLFTILLLVFSACSSSDSGPSIELRVEGSATNVAGGAINIAQGVQQQFRATLVQDGVDVPGAQFGWSIVANARDSVQRSATSPLAAPIEGTTADGGLVIIAPDQPMGPLRLNITTTHEGSLVSTHVIINVTGPPSLIPYMAHETFQDPETGTWWRVLLPDDGNGNALIITRFVHILNTRYHSNNGFTLFQSAEASTNVRNWWNNARLDEPNAVGANLRSRALSYEFQSESGVSIPRTSSATGAGIEVDRVAGSSNNVNFVVPNHTNVQRGHTRPLAPGVGTPEPFILSTSEANHYFSGNDGSQGRQTGLFNDFFTDAHWWLRSPGSSNGATVGRHALVFPAGFINAAANSGTPTNPNVSAGLRPALWIRR